MHSLLALERGEAEQLCVSMRISLDGLDALWQQRIRERYEANSPMKAYLHVKHVCICSKHLQPLLSSLVP